MISDLPFMVFNLNDMLPPFHGSLSQVNDRLPPFMVVYLNDRLPPFHGSLSQVNDWLPPFKCSFPTVSSSSLTLEC